MNRQRLDSPLVYVGAHNVYYVKLTVKVLYFTIHIHTQINQYVVISDFPPVSVEKFNHFIFRVPPLTVPDKCLLTQHQMQQKHRAWVSL